MSGPTSRSAGRCVVAVVADLMGWGWDSAKGLG